MSRFRNISDDTRLLSINRRDVMVDPDDTFDCPDEDDGSFLTCPSVWLRVEGAPVAPVPVPVSDPVPDPESE